MPGAKITKQTKHRRKPLGIKLVKAARGNSGGPKRAAGIKLSSDQFHALVQANLSSKSKRKNEQHQSPPKARD